ncbi:flavin containing amine oxidoreductase [Colletotrichum musicola]|uniref:Flavin containing amine oxidoreductase n=1 Tax=Colletotrichum musicola TaxID=2175873 RepID=A0A8H6U5M1_9PEZI|nr:flavin containing amine oxidoreductase [Colletotrichum musicola]
MRTSLRSRVKQESGFGKGPLTASSGRSLRISNQPSSTTDATLSRMSSSSPSELTATPSSSRLSSEAASEIAPEIVVWTEDMELDDPSQDEDEDDDDDELSSVPESNDDISMADDAPPDTLQILPHDAPHDAFESPMTNLSDQDQSELSSVPSSISSRATTPVDFGGYKEPSVLSAEPLAEASAETSAEAPVEAPAEAPVEAPVEAPAEAPPEAPPEVSVEALVDTSAETLVDTPAPAPVEAQAEALAEALAQAPTEVPTEAPTKDAPTEARAASSAEPSAELSTEPSAVSSTEPSTEPSTATPIRENVRRSFKIKPKSSIPSQISNHEYARQCIEAAESSRLNPYALHQEEYQLLRGHISHVQVTTYLNIRNGILRLWYSNPRVAVTRKEAVGCANARWFDVASVCYDWLLRQGYINFGCVEFPATKTQQGQEQETVSEAPPRRRRIVVIGAGMSGLGCARHIDGLIRQYEEQFYALGEALPEVIVLEGRGRIGGRLYSREFKSKPTTPLPDFVGERYTAEMGGMIITGFERGNPMNVLVRGQLCLPYRALRADTTIYDSNGKPVDHDRDLLVESLYNDCLDRVSEFKFKSQPSKLIQGNRDLINEGRDAVSDGHKTISQAEEAAAALPHAPSVSEQNVPERVNLVPVSSDKLTGRVHTQPGTPGLLTASEKARVLGWTLKDSVNNTNLDLLEAAETPRATLGSVFDEAITQYRNIVDLTAQDHRLLNWHVANLEYSNATNLHNLSLGGWDIDAGNEWEGKHTMIVGGYQSVPRGLLHCPTPLDVRIKSAVKKITYETQQRGRATVECEDGTTFDADYVVSTIPLGVLKQNKIEFDPPLPDWKTQAITRIGYGVLNKVVLVYDQPFWDIERHIFGVLRDATNRHSLNQSDYRTQRGRMFQWFNVTQTTGLPCLVALMAGDAGFDTEYHSNDALVAEATQVLRSVFGSKVPYPVESIVTRWAADRFARGSYSSAGPDMLPEDYDTMSRPIGNLFFAGEHTIGTHPATVHGAYLSGLRAASEVIESILGPIDIPTPLVLPRENVSNKRKEMEEPKDPEKAHLEAYEVALWEHIKSKIGERPVRPAKIVVNPYLLFSKAFFEVARKKCEEERAGKKKPAPNEVRVMTSKMWKAATPEEKKPFEEQAVQQKTTYAEAVEQYEEKSAKWDQDYIGLLAAYQKEHPYIPLDESKAQRSSQRESSASKHRRTKQVSYAESDDSDMGL